MTLQADLFIWRGVPLGPRLHQIWGNDWAIGVDRLSCLGRQIVDHPDCQAWRTCGRDARFPMLLPVAIHSLETWLAQGSIFLAPGVLRTSPRPARTTALLARRQPLDQELCRCGRARVTQGGCMACDARLCRFCMGHAYVCQACRDLADRER